MSMHELTRRNFFKGAVPGCAAVCLALKSGALFAQAAPEAAAPATGPRPEAGPGKHKFDLPMRRPLTYREFMTVQYAYHFIPFLRILEKDIGHERVIEILQKFSLWEAETGAQETVQARGKNDLSIFKEDYNPQTPSLTTEVLEDSERVWRIKITECLWARVWSDANAADLGYAAVCAGDTPYAGFINPKIALELQGTIMEGKPHCILRYHYL